MQAQPILLDAEVEALLVGANLPVADLATRPSLQMLGVREGGQLLGVVGVETLFLLTTTAADFFARRGYETVPRCAAPAPIAATPQFHDLCPASSAFMRKAIGKPR